MRKEHIEARLLYAEKSDVLDYAHIDSLSALLGRFGFHVQDVAAKRGDYIVLTTERMRLLIAYSPTPVALTQFQGVTRPAESPEKRREILARLARHAASLSIVALDRNGAEVESNAIKQRIVWELVDYLMSLRNPDLVQCPGLERLMTGREADDWLSSKADSLPEFYAGESSHRDARKEIFLKEPALSPEALAWFEQTQRDGEEEDLLGDAMREFLDLNSAKTATKMTDTAAGRSAVYVMSATVAMFALPIGAAILSYNALSGGSFRASGYAMAGTGIYSALDSLGVVDVAKAALHLI